jgi:hypothetical protein
MRVGFSCVVLFGLVLSSFTARAGASGKMDPVTGLPLYPATSNRIDPGDPVKLPASQICKCKQEADFYSVYDAKVSAAVAWCAANLAGFHKSHGYANSRSHDTFYNTDGTLIVSITGSRGKEGDDTGAYSIIYLKFTPGLQEKTILAMSGGKIVCP